MKSSDKNRRKALMAITALSPLAWVKPLVSGSVLPAHASTSCAFCVSWDVPGDGGGVVTIFSQPSCELIDNIGAQSGGACNDLLPGLYSLEGSGGSDGTTVTTVTAQCCGDTQILGQSTDAFTVFFELEIFQDGSCEIRAPQTVIACNNS